jgi:hypothetical protein
MTKFLARYRSRIATVLSGFDRLVFRGTLLPLVRPRGMFCFLQRAHVGLLDFKDYVLATSERVKAAALREAIAHDRPIRYLESSATDKEKLARCLLAESPVASGVRRLAAKITRQLRLLRAHGVIQKISKTHRYKLTPRGHLLTAALFAAREATLTQLIGHAA